MVKHLLSSNLISDYSGESFLSNVTNCITEIPQDIKLELNNGTLTLKAGSKVYIPNGFEEDGTTPKFDIRIIENNVSNTASFNTQHSMMYQPSLGSFAHYVQGYNLFSGSTDPTGVPTPSTNYNTTLNKIRFSGDGGSSWADVDYSLPFAITTSSSSQYTSIDQVFNGFGYIGSTAFALPGVKGLIPNGRNEDGTLKNYEFTVDKVLTFSLLSAETAILNIYDGSIGTDFATYTYSSVYIQETRPTQNQYMLWLDTSNNEFKYTEDSGVNWTKVNLFNVAKLTSTTNGKITSLTPKTAIHAVDYSDFVAVTNAKANVDLSNLSTTGEAKLKSNIQLVNELPANPEPGVLYCIPEA